MNSVDILVPNLPESVNIAQIATWHKEVGDTVKTDEILVEIETDKIILEVPAISSGVLNSILKIKGTMVRSQEVLGTIICVKNIKDNSFYEREEKTSKEIVLDQNTVFNKKINNTLSPTVRRLISYHDLTDDPVQGTGVNNRITPQDIEAYLNNTKKNNNKDKIKSDLEKKSHSISDRSTKKIKMSNLRKCIAERLLNVKKNTAMLTTFNEVNMQSIIQLRKKYGESFKEKHDIRLGFMSFYVKAVVEGLKRFPEINASIDNEDIIYYNYYDISIAVATPKGLVTPVLKNVDLMSMPDIEKKIKEFAIKAKESKLNIEDLTGGNFTITNGGVFGSLFSTPIINPPQSAILGLHGIKDRPVAVDNKICIHPMMYIALSYDHQIIDGKEAIGFLITVKEILEDFNRIVLNI
jgi:2-oxoglutarate dehydrogenase E2 component (dihydrolipoamide succinyltransferase)